MCVSWLKAHFIPYSVVLEPIPQTEVYINKEARNDKNYFNYFLKKKIPEITNQFNHLLIYSFIENIKFKENSNRQKSTKKLYWKIIASYCANDSSSSVFFILFFFWIRIVASRLGYLIWPAGVLFNTIKTACWVAKMLLFFLFFINFCIYIFYKNCFKQKKKASILKMLKC